MLFGYPIAATTDNWLHECLRETLQLIHACIETGNLLPEWPETIPAPYRNRLQKRTGLRDRLKVYQTALANLTVAEQNRILQAFNDQNEIALLLSCQCNCEAITELPSAIREPVKSLFEFAFSLLTDLEIRDRHYKAIYDASSYHVCPFCGCEYFGAPGAPREALDHYLPEYKYPFAAANLRNLVPMGNKCNSRYKLGQDILRTNDGARRRSFDPYNHGTVEISLDNSEPFAGNIGESGKPLPKWVIDFSFSSDEIATWDNVFHIRERYKRDILDVSFGTYLREFGNYCKSFGLTPTNTHELIDALLKYIAYQESNEFRDRAFFKAAVFRMLNIHCQNNDQRLVRLIMDVVNDVSV